MDLAAALSGPEFAKDAATFHLALSIEQDGVLASNPAVPSQVVSGGSPDADLVSNPRHTKIVFALVAGVFAMTGALAWYLLAS